MLCSFLPRVIQSFWRLTKYETPPHSDNVGGRNQFKRRTSTFPASLPLWSNTHPLSLPQRARVSGSAPWPACSRPGTSWRDSPSASSIPRSTSATAPTPCTRPSRECWASESSGCEMWKKNTHKKIVSFQRVPILFSNTETSATSSWDTFLCLPILVSPNSHR